jgi:signal recognition particle subunit SRP54
MFDRLSDKLAQVFKKLKGRGTLTEAQVNEAMREVRLALLEADVNYKVTKSFIEQIRERAVGEEVLKSLTPAQQVVKIVHEELTTLLGGEAPRLDLSGKPPVALMLVGLQGSGKTTTAAKLAKRLKSQGRQPYLAPADVQRPAAIEQLKRLAADAGVGVYDTQPGQNPVAISDLAMEAAYAAGYDTVILDTAGRLHIDGPLMEELKAIKGKVSPTEILLVADAMTGQEAVAVAQSFDDLLNLTGIVLTKVEGDARGGAALSMRAVIGKPIKFLGVGEKLDALEVFHPDRLASRILGMGDVLTLIEKAQETFDAEQVKALEKKFRQDDFTLEDFRQQLLQIRKMGPLEGLLEMIPGLGQNQGPQRGQARRKGIEAGGGHYPVHDPGGAGQPPDHQRQPPPAHRPGQRHHGGGRQPFAEEFHRHPENDKTNGQSGEEGEDAPPRRLILVCCLPFSVFCKNFKEIF